MFERSKSINLFLMDGTANGRIKCNLTNWTGVTYKIPRTELDKCKDREDMSQSGVYFLFGISEETGENVVYIGRRNPDKDYWTEAVVFTTSNNSLGSTEISYLEHRFCTIATDAKRYIVKNGNEPSIGNVTEEKESELEEFIDYAKIIMGTLGYKVFEPFSELKPIVPESNENNYPELILFLKRKSRKSGQIIEATCKQTSEGFVVLKGSHIETIDSSSIPPGIKEARQKAKIDTSGILQEDVLFRSPSYAAAFVIGGHVNGLTEWKTAEGKTLKEIDSTD